MRYFINMYHKKACTEDKAQIEWLLKNGYKEITKEAYESPYIYSEEELKEEYDELLTQFIREKYSIEDEIKVLRDKLKNSKADSKSFDEYDKYISECESKAHEIVYGKEKK